MLFEVIRTSDGFNKFEKSYEIELNTLEDLMNWIEEINYDVIIRTDGMLEIYDDWRE